MQKKVVIAISGGMDSTTLLYYLKSKKYEITALSFDYGQRHIKELAFARQNCNELGIKHQVVDLSAISKLFDNSCLVNKDIAVPEGHYQSETMKLTVVPNRNMMMLSIAIAYAENLKYAAVAIANHAGDHAIYPDCRPKFIKYLSRAAETGTYNKIKIFAPFTHYTKRQIAKIGLKLGVDYSKTWTCYKGEDKPCGKCGSCVERREALLNLDGGE